MSFAIGLIVGSMIGACLASWLPREVRPSGAAGSELLN